MFAKENMSVSKPVKSSTYKLRAPGVADHAIYFTIALEDDAKWLFVNSKDIKAFPYITSLMTSYSKQLKSGTPPESVIADMKESFCPHGSYFIPDGTNREVNSLVHHLGVILEEHINN